MTQTHEQLVDALRFEKEVTSSLRALNAELREALHQLVQAVRWHFLPLVENYVGTPAAHGKDDVLNTANAAIAAARRRSGEAQADILVLRSDLTLMREALEHIAQDSVEWINERAQLEHYRLVARAAIRKAQGAE